MGLNLLNRQKIEFAGLDIGTSAVKLVHLDKTADGYALVHASAEQIVPCSGDESKQQQDRADAVKACLAKANLRSRNIVCGISGPEVIVRGFTFPPLPDQAVEQAVQMEARQVCPLDIQQSQLDYQLIANTSTKSASKAQPRHGVMAVATQRAIQEAERLVTEAGAKPVIVDVNALALLNCLNELKPLSAQETAAVIDVGGSQTNVIIYGYDGLPFVRDINTAGNTIVQQISKAMDVTEKEIWQMFAQESSSSQLDNNLLLALNNAVVPLANAINETLRFYSFQEKKSGVDRIFLCGGFALIGAFVEFLTDALSAPVEILNPFSVITDSAAAGQNETLKQNGPAFAVAAGLAMRAL
ncbi:MAG: type IV pilus assembly protein PilM [Planctomycetota bacterium]|jgi:type IV pilus assembly protein PilM